MTATPTVTEKPKHRARDYSENGRIGAMLSQAAIYQAQIKELQAKLDAMRPVFKEHMLKTRLTTLRSGDTVVLLKERAKWQYSPATEREMLALRQLQKFEQQHGVAVNNATLFVSIETKGQESH